MPRLNVDPKSRKHISFIANGKKVEFTTKCNNERDLLCYAAVKKFGSIDLPKPKKTRSAEEQAAINAKMALLREKKKVVELTRARLVEERERKARKAAADALANEDAFYTEKNVLYAGEKKKPSKREKKRVKELVNQAKKTLARKAAAV